MGRSVYAEPMTAAGTPDVTPDAMPYDALLLLSFVADMFREKVKKAEQPAETPAAFDPMAGGFPVPPLPGQELPPVPRRSRRERELIVSGGPDTQSDESLGGTTDGKEASDG